MLKIEREMIRAINEGRAWHSGNTRVTKDGCVYVYDIRVAYRASCPYGVALFRDTFNIAANNRIFNIVESRLLALQLHVYPVRPLPIQL